MKKISREIQVRSKTVADKCIVCLNEYVHNTKTLNGVNNMDYGLYFGEDDVMQRNVMEAKMSPKKLHEEWCRKKFWMNVIKKVRERK